MYLNLDRLKLEKEWEIGSSLSWKRISEELDIRRPTLYAYKHKDPAKRARAINVNHLVSLKRYFNCSADELIVWEVE